MAPILQVKLVSKSFGGLAAINNCSFEVEENSITGLIGPNGAGKTTLFDIISGLLRPSRGKVIFKYDDVTAVPVYNRAALGIVRTFQNIRIFPELTALDNIVVAFREYPGSFLDVFSNFGTTVNALRKRAHDLLAIANLQDLGHHRAGDLSYGQKKLLEILRCVATDADLLLLDEPAAGVNRTMLHQIIDLIKILKREGKTILLVEHDMGFVMNLCEKIVVLDFGVNIAEGTPKEIQGNKKVLQAYLGKKPVTHA